MNNPTNAKEVKIYALGCRLNTFEGELIKTNLNNTVANNTIVVNTCTVTNQAHKQSMQLVRKLKKQNPNHSIVVTGCGVEFDSKGYNAMPEVDKIISNANKFNVNAYLSNNKIEHKDVNLTTSKDYKLETIPGYDNKTRAFVQVQQGCDHRCSFCVIYKARGNSRSVSVNDIITQVQKLVNFGHKEIVLTGVDISSYNRSALAKEPSKIGQLSQQIINAVPNLQRLRLSSLDPAVKDDTVLQLLASNPKFMPHLHLSLQSLNNKVLQNMGRRHSKESAIAWIEQIKQANPNTAIGADIIVGFPTESEEQFIDTYNTIKQLQIPFLHIFPYSQRSGTPAYKMQQVPKTEIKKRASLLQELSNSIKNNYLKTKIGLTQQVLLEANNCGYTADYCHTKVNNATPNQKGKIINTKIIAVENNQLIAEVV